MPFKFLKYLHPTHYFQLFRNDGSSVYPLPEALPKEFLKQLEMDQNFQSEAARQYDLSWQGIHKGYLGEAETYASFEKLPIVDEYRFLRKYFNRVWVFYVLLLRLVFFKNPFQEISAFRNSANTKRSDYLKQPILHEGWEVFDSALVSEAPMVSVVIPTLNRYEYLKDVLSDFEKQTYSNFEIIIIDQSEPFQENFCKSFDLNIRHIRQPEPALWLARNTAINKSLGNIIALSEDDVRIPTNWIENHLKALDFFKADISAGVFYPKGQTIPPDRSFFA